MAAKKKKGAEALVAQTDPKAPLDGAAFLSAAQKTLKALAEDLLARADGSASITEGLKARWAAEQEKRRTGDAYEPWRRRFVVQVGVAWILGCVFARTLEDRGLVDRNRVAGPGAADSVRQFLDMAPHLTEREYLLTVFRELANLRAARDLFDARHNPVWKLAPSADGAKLLMDLFRGPDAEAPAFRFGQSDTRFLGDLYQDLSDEVRERFALLQTPRFVESFILDQTLEPAIKEFGLDQATIIDPTCGSGHFLLGAFERLVDHRLRAQPGLDVREAAAKALDAVHGADINPYAAAIARFRLVLAFLERGSYTRIEDAPELPIHVVVGDSLLHGRGSSGQEDFAHVAGTDASKWKDDLFALEDEAEAKRVLRKRYSAVVGNPPYITVRDAVLREEYRKLYPETAFRAFSLGVPFTERFFDLARDSGRVGMINANSFMKREFGRRLITEFMPRIDLRLVVNTQGAFIPGHGTPTVLLFGVRRQAADDAVRVVLARRGEPSTPDEAEQGLVWRSIVDNVGTVGFENDFITVTTVERRTLNRHPWSLGGGGAAELKELLEERAERRLSDLGVDIGTGAVTREDEVFLLGDGPLSRARIPERFRCGLVAGENVRDWAVSGVTTALWPYELETLEPATDPSIDRLLWPWRQQLSGRVAFGKSQLERGLPFTAYSMFFADRFRVPLTIAFAFVATHNHFVLDRDRLVFGRTAPIIKLPPEATEDDHLALLAYLNSSTACFWMKQVMMDKGATSDRGVLQADPEKFRFEFDGTKLASTPIPGQLREFRGGLLVEYARRLCEGAEQLADDRLADAVRTSGHAEVDARLAELRASRADVRRMMVAWQEELDWAVYELFGLLDEHPAARAAVPSKVSPLEPDDRPYRAADPQGPRGVAMKETPEVALMERGEYKRRWFRAAGAFDAENVTDEMMLERIGRSVLAERIEALLLRAEIVPVRTLASEVRTDRIAMSAATALKVELSDGVLGTTIEAEAVPYCDALAYSATGREKRDLWRTVWDAQRMEDAGTSQNSDSKGLPPRFDAKDFAEAATWALRGKLDVPKERFISYPGCESDEDKSPVYGWAGWDYLQRAQALSALYQKRKNEEAWGKDRLTPMLAGLQELVPWLKQWHNDPDPNFGGERLGNFFADFVASECQALGLTLDDLKNWRPPAKTRGAAKKKTATRANARDALQPASDDEAPASTPKKKRAKKGAASPDEASSEVVPSPDAIAFAKRDGFLAE